MDWSKLELETGVGSSPIPFFLGFAAALEEDGVLRAYIYDSIRRAGRFQDVKRAVPGLEWNTDMEENEWIAEQMDIVTVEWNPIHCYNGADRNLLKRAST